MQENKLFKIKILLKYWPWSVSIAVVIVVAVMVALNAKNDQVKDMATSAFGGAIVGALIVFYEQIREDQRETIQFERDRQLAYRIRQDANRESDLRQLADYLLVDAWPALNQLVSRYHYSYDADLDHDHNGIAALNGIKNRDAAEAMRYKLIVCSKQVRRVNDDELNMLFGPTFTAIVEFSNVIEGGESDTVDENSGSKLLGEFKDVINRAEDILKESDS